MNPPPSAKENRQARKYWFEFEREVIAPPIQERLAQGAKNGAFRQGRENRANAEKRAPEKQFISPRQTEQVMNRALSRPCSSDEFHPGQTMKTHTPRSRPNKARHSRHCMTTIARANLHAVSQSPMFARGFQPMLLKRPPHLSPAWKNQREEQI
ncbi:hypothetical protein [uncultured Ottowia sp.]|uniref:hypothetical protein n=1 Tax=uncultured Ottowia sp. TaxID=543067 RepID=UPI0025914CA9|nr:hypothetical protein [uncultured Ottowia sp.]